MATRRFDYSQLTPAERIQLAEELWDSVTSSDITLTQAQADELDRRREHLRKHGSRGRPWREALEELKKRRA